MNGFEIEIPDLEAQIMSLLQRRVDAALSAAEIVRPTIKDLVILGNIDVDGGQFAAKKPRPKKNPTNEPNFACLDKGDMMSEDRWSLGELTENSIEVVYDPPYYFDFLINKDPNHGGRRWMTRSAINDDARRVIEDEMAARARAVE